MFPSIDKNIFKTLTFKLTLYTQLIIIPLVFFLIFDNLYSIGVLHNKLSESKGDTLALYMKEMDSELKSVDDYLIRIITSDMSFANLENADSGIRDLSKINLRDKIVQAITSYNMIDGFFAFSNVTNDYIYSYSMRTQYSERMEISEYMKQIGSSKKSYSNRQWFPVTIGSKQYVVRMLNVGNTYLGAWINVDTVVQLLNQSTPNAKAKFILATTEGRPLNNIQFVTDAQIDLAGNLNQYYFTGTDQKYMVVGRESSQGEFRLTSVDNEKMLLAGLNRIQIVIFIIALLSISCIPLIYLVLRKWIFNPINKLKNGIKKMEGGDLNTNIDIGRLPYEFELLTNTFNNFTSQINQLKIDVYEEQIQKQKAELQYLQTQIKPHFYLNAFNTIFSMAEMKDYRLIQDMAKCLSDYLRYMVRGNSTLVPFEEELRHVRNFLEIQKIRSGENLVCNVNSNQSLMSLQIPPLILHTFIENIVKHALIMDQPITVFIHADLLLDQREKKAKIVIEDTGRGFPQDVLSKIQSDTLQNEAGESIGIWNVKQRLKLIYGDKASITFKNGEHSGAHIEITVPAEMGRSTS